MMAVSGCSEGLLGQENNVPVVDPTPAFCLTLDPLVDAHADALVVDGGPESIGTGVRVIASYDSLCELVEGA